MGRHQKSWVDDMPEKHLRQRQGAVLKQIRQATNNRDADKLVDELERIEYKLENNK